MRFGDVYSMEQCTHCNVRVEMRYPRAEAEKYTQSSTLYEELAAILRKHKSVEATK